MGLERLRIAFNALRLCLLCVFAGTIALPVRSQSKDSLTIFFDFGKYEILPAQQSILERFIENKNAGGHHYSAIAVEGFCDIIGGFVFNDSLSRYRARTVLQWLTAHGVVADTVSVSGFGKRRPVNQNTNAEERAQNRRATIYFTGIPPTPVVAEVEKTEVPKRDTVSLPPAEKATPPTVYKQLTDTSLQLDSKITLPNVNFYGGRHIPIGWSYIILDDIVKALQSRPELKIVIEGYVCCEPEDRDGMDIDTRTNDLSVRRAKYIYEYLAEKGISKSRMSYAGFGGSKKLYPMERTESEKTLNRRIEIRVVGR